VASGQWLAGIRWGWRLFDWLSRSFRRIFKGIIMATIYYHTPISANAKQVVWSNAKSLTEAGKTLAKHNRIWPDSSSDGQVITIGKKQRGRTGIRPIKEYRLFGDKLVKISDYFLTDGWIRP